MSDYISIQEAIEKINERARETFTLASGYEYYLGALHDVADDLRQMPTVDAVPVVRCKDCKYYEEQDGDDYEGEQGEDSWGVCRNTGAGMMRCGYCSYGERKDDE